MKKQFLIKLYDGYIDETNIPDEPWVYLFFADSIKDCFKKLIDSFDLGEVEWISENSFICLGGNDITAFFKERSDKEVSNIGLIDPDQEKWNPDLKSKVVIEEIADLSKFFKETNGKHAIVGFELVSIF